MGVVQLCMGICRLVLFSAIFILLVQCNDVGVPSSIRLGVSMMLDDALDIAEFRDIRTLNNFQDFLIDSSDKYSHIPEHQNPRTQVPCKKDGEHGARGV